MGCQKDIAEKIVVEKKADYVLNLKKNHHLLREEVEEYFKDAEADGFKEDRKITHASTLEKGHGRIEERLYYYSTNIGWMDAQSEWKDLKGLGMAIPRCEMKGKKTEERVYYLTSVDTVEELAKGARAHWGVESMHSESRCNFS